MGQELGQALLKHETRAKRRVPKRFGRHDMRHEVRDLPVPIHRGDRGGGDLGQATQMTLDLAELDAKAVEFDLQIEAAAEMQHALGVEITLIAGSVGTHGGAVEHSIVEDARREVGPPKVAAGDRIALDNDLAEGAGGNGTPSSSTIRRRVPRRGAPTGKGSGLAAISVVTSTEVTATVDSVGP